MDAETPRCKQCGELLPAKRNLKDFCTYAHRGQFNALKATETRTGLSGAKNIKQNKALQALKRESVGSFTFARTNDYTFRLDQPRKLGAGWLMEVAWPGGARQQWVARVGNRASQPLTLHEAKRAAVAMLRERGQAESGDRIAELNKIAAAEVSRHRVALAKERKRWPCDLVGRSRHGSIDGALLRNAILDAEISSEESPSTNDPLSGDDYPLEFYADGYPKLPACLRRSAQ
jgi:hypothetical protein